MHALQGCRRSGQTSKPMDLLVRLELISCFLQVFDWASCLYWTIRRLSCHTVELEVSSPLIYYCQFPVMTTSHDPRSFTKYVKKILVTSSLSISTWGNGEAFDSLVNANSFWNRFNPVKVIFSAFNSGSWRIINTCKEL